MLPEFHLLLYLQDKKPEVKAEPAKAEVKTEVKPEPVKPEPSKTELKAELKTEVKPESKPESKPEPAKTEPPTPTLQTTPPLTTPSPQQLVAAVTSLNALLQDKEALTDKVYHALKEEVMADETTAALLKEYKKLQVRLQMAAVSGTQPDNDDMQRFQGISALLFGKMEVSQYLLAEMRLQQEVAGILRIITDAADIDMGMGQ